MPVIRQYQNPVAGLSPDDRGTNAAADAARRAGASFDQIARDTRQLGEETASAGRQTASMAAGAIKGAGGVAVDYAEHQEKMHGAAADAALTDQLTQQWNEKVKSADPNDPTVAARFREEVLEPNLEKFGQSFWTEGGQKFAEARVERLRNHMFEKTAADMGALAAAAVSANIRTIANARSNTAVSDPSAVPHLLSTIDADVADVVASSPNLKGAAAAKARIDLTEKMRDQIVKSGAIGAIQRAGDPEAEAARWIAKYPDYINGPEAIQLARAARTQKQSAALDQERAIRLQDKIRKDTSEAVREGYLMKLYSDDPKEIGSITAKGIVNDPNLTVQDKEHMIGIVKRETKPETEARVSNGNAVDLLDRIRLPEGDPRRIDSIDTIYQARIDGKLSKSDFEATKKEFLDLRSPEGQRLGSAKEEFIKAVGPLIDKSNPLMGKIDQDGKQNIYRLNWDLNRKIDEYRKAGKNPYDLLDPSKPDYMGRPDAITPYQKTLQQSIRDQAERLRGGGGSTAAGGGGIVPPGPPKAPPPARKSGETPEQYLKRTGQ